MSSTCTSENGGPPGATELAGLDAAVAAKDSRLP